MVIGRDTLKHSSNYILGLPWPMKPQPTTKPTISLAGGNFSQIKINFLPTNTNVRDITWIFACCCRQTKVKYPRTANK